MFTLTS